MMDTCYDFAIVGAGPAGATLARLLASKFRVLLIDRQRPGQQKCCGGLLAPDAQKAMATMGLGLPAEVLDGPQLFAVNVLDVDGNATAHYQRFYLNMHRGRFDGFLRSLLPENVTFLSDALLLGANLLEDGWQLDCRGAGKRIPFRARYLIGADGAGGKVRSLLGGNHADRLYTTYQRFFDEKHGESVYTAVFDSRISDFYHWVIPKADYSVVGVTVPHGKSAKQGMATLLETLYAFGMPYANCVHEEGTLLRRPRRPGELVLGDEEQNLFLLGEAAGFISPSSAEGISYGLRSALCLGRAILESEEGRWMATYRRGSGSLRGSIGRKVLKLPVMYQPFLRRMAIKSKLLSINVEPL